MCEVSKIKYEGKITDHSIFVEKLVEAPNPLAWPKKSPKERDVSGSLFPALKPAISKAG